MLEYGPVANWSWIVVLSWVGHGHAIYLAKSLVAWLWTRLCADPASQALCPLARPQIDPMPSRVPIIVPIRSGFDLVPCSMNLGHEPYIVPIYELRHVFSP